MTKRLCRTVVAPILVGLSVCVLPLTAEVGSPALTARHSVRFAVSPPLRELANLPMQPQHAPEDEGHLPRVDFHSGQVLRPALDPVEQSRPGSRSNISIGLSVPGIPRDPNNGYPGRPDTNAAVGDAQVVEWVNVRYAVFNKATGEEELGPINGNLLWQNLGGPCYENNDGDIIAQWDKVHHRWLLAQNDFNYPEYGPPFYVCVAVSTSADATGSYYLYQFPLGNNLPDYPKWGIWPSGYFQTQNAYSGINYAGAFVCAYNSAKLLIGDSSAEQICFQLTPSDYALLPGDVDSQIPPPANQDEFFIGSYNVDQTNNHLYIYSMHPDFANPSQSIFTGSGLANPITVPTYTAFCPSPAHQNCVPQEETPTLLGSLGDVLMYRLAYWDDGPLANVGTHAGRLPQQHWYVNHVVTASGGQAGVRWYEFRAPVRAVTVSDVSLFQAGTLAPDSNYRWMGSIAGDKAGDIALGYSIASSTMWDSIAISGRVPSDPLGQMEAETIATAGTGSQGGDTGWGDYSSMALDSDGCTFWYAQEYYVTPVSDTWQTSLISFRFNGCH